MRRSVVAVAVGLLTAVLLVPLGSSPSSAVPVPSIVGGFDASAAQFPYMASVGGITRDSHACGGTLIDKDWVLTAAHCLVGVDPSDVMVAIGRTDLMTGNDGETRPAAQLLIHPDYQDHSPYYVEYDVGLIKLKWSVTELPTVRLALGSERQLWDPGDYVLALGWGAQEYGGPISPTLRKVMVPIVADDEMSAPYVYGSNFKPATMLGYGPLSGGYGTCHGDSGGPLLSPSIHGWRQVGLASWHYGCAQPYKPGVAARIADYRLSKWIISHVPSLANDGAINRSGDINGDGRDDLVVFNRNACDIWVTKAVSGGGFGPASQWHEQFGCGEQIPLVGDFNADGRADVAALDRSTVCDVYVAVSIGTDFIGTYKWSDHFACGTDIPAVGDVNGDGYDDLVTFTRGSTCDVYVALSHGFGFDSQLKWHDMFGCWNEIPATGDFNGDGRDDIAAFGPNFPGPVYVATSTGSGFVGTGVKWHNGFSFQSTVPAVGDFNADGRDDIIFFTRGDNCDVFVSTSTGSSFGTATKWHEMFSCGNEIPGVGDFNADGRDDVVTYTRGSTCDVYIAPSIGNLFFWSMKWSDYFGCAGEIPIGSSTWW